MRILTGIPRQLYNWCIVGGVLECLYGQLTDTLCVKKLEVCELISCDIPWFVWESSKQIKNYTFHNLALFSGTPDIKPFLWKLNKVQTNVIHIVKSTSNTQVLPSLHSNRYSKRHTEEGRLTKEQVKLI